MNYTVIFAGGVGVRMGSTTPKQFLKVGGKPIIIHVLEKFSNHPEIDGIVVVCKEEYIDECRGYIKEFGIGRVLDVIPGGETGQLSIRNGVEYLVRNASKESVSEEDRDIVLVHDGVRPIITGELISACIKGVKEHGNCIAASHAIETVITVNEDGSLKEIEDRSLCRNAKAPQCFYLDDLWDAHRKAAAEGITNMIDSAMLMSRYGHLLYTTECSPDNIKITTPNDYYMFKGMYEKPE